MKQTMTKQQAETNLSENLSRYFGASLEDATVQQMYKAAAITVRDLLADQRRDFQQQVNQSGAKQVYYLCMEFLVGRSLKNNLFNLGLTEVFEQVMSDHNMSLAQLYEEEPDAGLGNGGLGRLAACFMDSLATLNYPATGFSIRYEYGLFKQKIVDGWQMELPDVWLPGGEVWLIPREDDAVTVRFGGQVEEQWLPQGMEVKYHNCETVEAMPYDMMISGSDSNGVSKLRLWRARDLSSFDMDSFASGDYARTILESHNAELISKVLYPPDNHFEGRALRLKQQYFLVSASIQNIVNDYLRQYGTLDQFAERVAIHINDTHPALCIPELMRIFMDEHHYSWEAAFSVVSRTVAYTNHTVLAEALEKWPEDLFERQLPRIHTILKELNQRFCGELWQYFPGDWDRIERMSLLSHGQVRMANLSVMGAHSVNGVSELHSEILKKDVFSDFSEIYSRKFQNVTNGIAHRRWLCQANPRLASLIHECIGDGYQKEPEQLSRFSNYADDTGVLDRLEQIKQANKRDFSDLVHREAGILPDPQSVFNVQAKRLHEYKRQLMNALRVISLYQDILEDPQKPIRPQTFFFAAKAAPGYEMAKQIIRLICYVAAEIERTPHVREKLRVVFLDNYRVTLAESMMPATEISQQISLAGKEASGTGNMKMMINGAVTIGTLDGANVEIAKAVGEDNIFLFGLKDKEVEELWRKGYAPSTYYQSSPRLKNAVDRLKMGFGGQDFSQLYQYLVVGSHGLADPYMCLADFNDYVRVHELLNQAYEDRNRWNRISLRNIASAGYFAADRSIREYAEKIWHIHPVL